MTIRLYGAVKDQGLVAEADLGRRLGELALCCRGLEIAIDDFCAGAEGDAARRLARLATRVADQSERLARAMEAHLREPLN
jgi:hypothetical protein